MNYITFKKMFDYVDRIEKARSHKYIDRRPKKTGKGWYYIYAETFKKPFRALLEIFDIKKERIDKDYEEDNIQKDFGVDKNLYASHVLEFFLNREKWHNIFSKKENRQKYTQAVKQSDVEKKAKEKKEKSTEKKKTTTETTKTQKLNRSLMFRIWKRNTPEAEKLLEQDKERTTDEGNSVEQIKNALKEDFKNKAIEKPQIEYSRENYDKLFPRGNIKTPIGHVKLGENQYEKLKAKSREDLLGVVAETLKNPLVIINENGSHIYAKSFLESGKTKSYQSVVVKIDGQDISISTHQRDTNNILNKIKKAEDVIYTNDSQQLPGSRNASVAGTTRETKFPHFDSQNVNPNEVSDNSEEMSSTEHGNKEAMKGNQNAKKDLTDGELAVRLNLAYLNGILEKNHIQTIENPQIGEISVEAGKTGKHGYGLKHIIEQRFKKDGKNENEIAALIMLVADAAGSGEIRNNNGNRIEIVKNGIMAIVSKERNGKKENWLLTGYDLFDEKEKATDAINEVISRYGYTPGFSGLKTQVGAVIASLEDYTSKETNVNGEHGNKTAMLGNQNAKKNFGVAKQLRDNFNSNTNKYLGKKFTNKKTGIEAEFSTTSQRELRSKLDNSKKNGFTIQEHFELANKIKELFEGASLEKKHKDDKNNDENVNIERFLSEPVLLSTGKKVQACITVKYILNKDGHYVYSLETMDIKNALAKTRAKGGDHIGDSPNTNNNNTNVENVNEVKPQTDSEMKKEQENTKKARKEAGLPDIGKNYGERVSALEDAYSLNPNAENYAYKDTGYIAGSQREKVQNTLKRKAEMGETVNVDDVDWNALEENSRTAAQLITKDNIIGKIDYQKMKDKGIDSRAAAMITSIYRSIGKEPVDNTPEGRKNFVWAISTLRERLESCKTYKEVFAMIKEIGEERSGKYTTLLSMDSEYGELETQYNNIINSQKEINNKIINNYNLNLNRKFKNKEERTEYWQNFLKKEYPGLDEFKISYGYYSSPHEKLPYISIEETKINELREKKKAAFKGAVERIELANPMLKAWKQLGDKCLDDYGRPAKSIFDYYNAFTNLEIWKGSTAFTSQKDSNYAKYLNWGWEEKDKTKKEQSSIVKGRVKQKFEMIVPDKYERIGGRNVSVDSSQELKKAYNFREVQVGTWVQTDVASAKWHTDNINEGFADLCDITGIPDNLVSMNGRIAIAIGARGVKGAKAHYEPGERVIQINKMKGGGSLGHEWFHAFDNLISEAINGGDYNEWFTWQGKDQIKMASSHGNNKSSVKQVVSNNNDSLNQKVRDKFTNLVHAMMEGDTPETNTVEFDEEQWNKCQSFYNLKTKIARYKPRTLNAAQTFTDAKKIIDEYYDDRIAREKDYQSRGYTSGMSVEKLTQEKIKSLEFAAIKFADKEKGETEYLTGRVVSRYYQDAKKLGNGYWDTPHEMAARAFQCWLNDKLKEQGRKNTYLVGMVDNDKYGGVFYPYPTERDRIKINKAFDELFKVIKSENAIRKALQFEESAHPRGNGGRFTSKFAADKGGVFGGNERTYNKKKFSDLTDEEKQQKKKQIRSNIVSKVKIGIIHKTEDKRASDVAYEWVDENIKGDIFTVIGNVKFNRKTVKEDLSHGFGQEKLDTLTAVKDVLEKGTYLGYERNFQGETNENHYFAGKIKYGNDEKIVFCRVKDSAGGNSCFYVHEVFTEDEIKSDLPRLGVRETDSSRLVGKPLYKFILQTIFNVNDDNIIRKAIFLSKLNHEFCKLVEREKRKEAYLDKLGRGYIAYLKKHHPELV